jgi:restriction system protein
MAINFHGAQFMGQFGEITGYKSGLALTEDRFREIFASGGYENYWPARPDAWLRIRSDELEEIFAFVLAQLGAGPSAHVPSPMVFVFHQVKDDPESLALLLDLGPKFTELLTTTLADSNAKKIDPTPFIEAALLEHGKKGLKVALMITKAVVAHQVQSPWSAVRRMDWKDVRDLDDLFASEQLGGPHGEYFDQRFVNFLTTNFDQIGEINWRQFEGLAAEFFKREGYAVELGPGRNDGGVDIRLRPADAPSDAPAVVLVQCKREKRKIGKAIVKALWADIVAEGAESGMIVTTSSFSPGAAAVRTARGYPILEADRARVRSFVDALKTPESGLYLAE